MNIALRCSVPEGYRVAGFGRPGGSCSRLPGTNPASNDGAQSVQLTKSEVVLHS
jgi:hypothetical protein